MSEAVSPDFGYIPQGSEQGRDTASIIARIDPTKVSEILLRELAGEIFDPDSGKFIKNIHVEPLLNAYGMSRIKMSFNTLINNNTALSNLSEKEIKNVMHGFAKEMINLLTINCTEFGIKSPTDASTILQAVMNNAMFTLKRGFNAGEKKFLNTSLRTHETVSHIQQPKQSKFGLDKFRF